jgi:4-aminobutyrate aminotransferase/(S)-3-amino-2-methylpropionate transaminase
LGDGVVWAPFPCDEEESDAALAAVAEALEAGSGSEIGTVLIEPIQGRAGVRVPPPGFLEQVGALARRSGALVVADEILTGMGRTGEYFASVAMGLVPDLVCVGKALGGGFPLSACLAPRAVMDAWPASDGEAIHTSTFLGHPLSAASALAFLDVMENEQICARARELGHAMVGLLREELAQTSVVREIRGRGLLVGVELGVGESAEPGRNGLAGVAAQAALGSGLILLPAGERGNVLELMPPVTVTEEQTQRAVEILRDVLDSLS